MIQYLSKNAGQNNGAVAQLVERTNGIRKATGSIPVSSTITMNISLEGAHSLLQAFIDSHAPLATIIENIHASGGHVYCVGGAVRDALIGYAINDLDCEVHGLDPVVLESILARSGTVNTVGKSFGVYKLSAVPVVDWALPRKDSAGRKPVVAIDINLPIKQALRRRDVTINAIAYSLRDTEFIDPYNGITHLKERCLKAVDSELFVEDPLRFFRVMQFHARFELSIDPSLEALCKNINITDLAPERIADECKKMMLKSKKPSLGFRWMHSLGRLSEWLPEIALLATTFQSPVYHPEGNVFEHSMQVLDAMAEQVWNYAEKERIVLLWAALLHDCGKYETTIESGGTITSYKHDIIGSHKAKSILKRFFVTAHDIKAISSLIAYHMHPLNYYKNNAQISTYKKLAASLSPVTLEMLFLLCLADARGRNSDGTGLPLPEVSGVPYHFYEMAKKAGVLHAPVPPLIQGRDLLCYTVDVREYGAILASAYEMQMSNNIEDKGVLLRQIEKKHKLLVNIT